MHKMCTAFTYTRNRTGPSMYLQYTSLVNAVHESGRNNQIMKKMNYHRLLWQWWTKINNPWPGILFNIVNLYQFTGPYFHLKTVNPHLNIFACIKCVWLSCAFHRQGIEQDQACICDILPFVNAVHGPGRNEENELPQTSMTVMNKNKIILFNLI